MKKVYLVLTLLMTSLFFFSTNEVRAATVYTVNSSDLDYINDDFFKMRELAIEYCNENNKYYFIVYNHNRYEVHFIPIDTFTSTVFRDLDNGVEFYYTGNRAYVYSLNDTVLVQQTSDRTFTYNFITDGTLNYFYYLDTNLDDLVYTGTSTFTISYNNLSYKIESNTAIPTLYQIYLDDLVNDDPPEVPVVENEVIANYYSTVISKIGYLVESISSNQVYLSVIVIFLLIFITELIFRRFI